LFRRGVGCGKKVVEKEGGGGGGGGGGWGGGGASNPVQLYAIFFGPYLQ